MYCKYCGREISDSAVYCIYCGNRVGESTSEEKGQKNGQEENNKLEPELEAINRQESKQERTHEPEIVTEQSGEQDVDPIEEQKSKNNKLFYVVLAAVAIAAVVLFATVLPKIIGGGVEASFKNVAAGDVVEFGSFEQDDKYDNGPEPIEWIVLSNEDDKVFLISKYCLASIPFNYEYEETSWVDCTVRQWLNGDFFYSAFSEEEQEYIALSKIEVSNPERGNYFDVSEDKVFLLSLNEVYNYFQDDEKRIASPTATAFTEGCWARDPVTEDSYMTSNSSWYEVGDIETYKQGLGTYWWLRTPGEDDYYATFVNYKGEVIDDGVDVDLDYYCVRPAIVVEIKH